MNWIWILVLLCCCNGGKQNHDMIQPRRCGGGDYPRPPFAPDCEERRDRREDCDCGCRASEMNVSDDTEDDCDCN